MMHLHYLQDIHKKVNITNYKTLIANMQKFALVLLSNYAKEYKTIKTSLPHLAKSLEKKFSQPLDLRASQTDVKLVREYSCLSREMEIHDMGLRAYQVSAKGVCRDK